MSESPGKLAWTRQTGVQSGTPHEGGKALWANHQAGKESSESGDPRGFWFTGLSDAAKSTITHGIEPELFNRGIRFYVLNGDNVRHGLNSGLEFSPQDRKKNIWRIVEGTNLSVDAGFIVLI